MYMRRDVQELMLLRNNIVGETFLHKSGEMRRVDLIFIIGMPAWRWLGEYVTKNKILFKQAE